MNIPYVMKRCTVCGEWLVANTVNFRRAKKGQYGLEAQCKECRNKKNKQWRKANRDKMLEYRKANKEKKAKYNKQYYQDNKERIAEHNKQWYEDNKERIAERAKQYYQSPQGQVVAFNGRQRRRLKEEEQGTGITKDQWLEMMGFFDWRCAYSGEYIGGDSFNRTIDHIVPLNSNGDNMIWNCVPMKLNYNSSKHTKDMLEWYREQDFYSEARLAKIYEWQEYARKKWKK